MAVQAEVDSTFREVAKDFAAIRGRHLPDWRIFRVPRAAGASPHIWAGFIGGSFVFLSILTLVVGFIGEILLRIRLNQEMMLYFLRRHAWTEARDFQALPRSGGSSSRS